MQISLFHCIYWTKHFLFHENVLALDGVWRSSCREPASNSCAEILSSYALYKYALHCWKLNLVIQATFLPKQVLRNQEHCHVAILRNSVRLPTRLYPPTTWRTFLDARYMYACLHIVIINMPYYQILSRLWLTHNGSSPSQHGFTLLCFTRMTKQRVNKRQMMLEARMAMTRINKTIGYVDGSWSSSVLSVWLDGRFRSPAEAKASFSNLCVHTGSDAHPASCSMGTWVVSQGVTLTTHPV